MFIVQLNLSYKKPNSGFFNFNIKTKSSNLLIGRNGMGKSTLALKILGLAQLNTNETVTFHPALTLSNISYVPQRSLLTIKPNLTDVRVNDFLEYSLEAFYPEISFLERQDIIFNSLDQMGIIDLIDTKIGTLSYGQERLVQIAHCITNPYLKLLIMDEPFASLDQEYKNKYLKIIVSLQNLINLTSLVITHDLEIIYYFEYIYHLQENQFHECYNNNCLNKDILKENHD